MTPHNSVSIIMPALNEGARLAGAVGAASEAARSHFQAYEIIVVDDCSRDDTARVADELAARDEHITVVHRTGRPSLGRAFREGLARASMEYCTVFHAKGDTTAVEIGKVWEQKDRADLVIPYVLNAHERVFIRKVISDAFASCVNLLFGLKVRYYTHFVLCRRALLDRIRIRSNSYAYQAEIVIKLLRLGCTYHEVGLCDDFAQSEERWRAFHPRNLWGVAAFLVTTFCEVHLSKTYRRPVTGEDDSTVPALDGDEPA